MTIAIAVVMIVVLYPIFHKIGDVLPMAAAVATVVAVLFFAPEVPHSPVACLSRTARATCSGAAENWVYGLVFLLPLAVAVLIKMVRGDKRGGGA